MLLIRHEVNVRAPAARCFDLTRSVDLHVDASTEISARAVGGRCTGLSRQGDATVWSAHFFGVRFPMTTRIENYLYPQRFGDRMIRGVRRFAHAYRFRSLPDGGCLLSDELIVEAPGGFLGRPVEAFYLRRRMDGLVRRRLEHIKAVAEGHDWERYLRAEESAP